jgi:TolA-binding protein
MKVGLMRSFSLIRQVKLDEAMALLRQMDSWSGPDAEHAQATFLVGWICLQKNAVFDASMTFRKVIDRYPQTPFAAKAREMVSRLEGL